MSTSRFPLPLLVLASACVAPGLVSGNGVEVTAERDVGAFTGVSADNLVRVEVALGDAGPVVLTCDENLLPHIETVVDDGVLHIRTSRLRHLATELDCVASVTAPAYESLASNGSGGLRADAVLDAVSAVWSTGSGSVVVGGVSSERFEATVTGSGGLTIDQVVADEVEATDSASGRLQLDGIDALTVDATSSGSGGIVLSGVATSLTYTSSGSGGIDGEALVGEDALVFVSGSGGVRVNATESVEVHISSSGGVAVFGEPESRSEDINGSGGVVYP